MICVFAKASLNKCIYSYYYFSKVKARPMGFIKYHMMMYCGNEGIAPPFIISALDGDKR
jgi:hypothetical protein